MRLSATKALLDAGLVIVATVSSIYGLVNPEAYMSMMLHLVKGEPFETRRCCGRLTDMQYQRNDMT